MIKSGCNLSEFQPDPAIAGGVPGTSAAIETALMSGGRVGFHMRAKATVRVGVQFHFH